jgi:RNA polymerase sigma-54 factor
LEAFQLDQSLSQHQYAEQTMKVSPTLIMVNQLLALSSLELQHVVRAEIEQNPALESVESTTCTSCGAGTTGLYCQVCLQPVHASTNGTGTASSNGDHPGANFSDDGYESEDYRPRESAATALDFEDFDPLTLIGHEASMPEQLLADLMASLPYEDHVIAAYMVGNLDEQGFLCCSTAYIASVLDVPHERVEMVLQVLQRSAPVGVGARDLRECLLMQLRDLREKGEVEIAPYVEEVITSYLLELGEHKFTIIAQTLGTSYENIVAVRDFIKKQMQPRPLQEPPEGRTWRAPTPTRFVLPDVMIRERDGQLEAEVVESYRFSLKINPLYQRLAADGANGNHAGMSNDEREHIRRYLNRSKLFIANINQRRETMLRITSCLIQLQEDFIRLGVRNLRPLTRAQVAQYLGIHESTVSRATADKYVMLPHKQVIPFSDFFSASLSAKDVIKELITKEGRPMTDKEIVLRLRDQGIRVARRTVTKYRNQLGIMPSAFR